MNMTRTHLNMYKFPHFVEGKTRKAGNNRKVGHRITPGGHKQIYYTLHGHEVASLTDVDGEHILRLDNCGYTTMTTGKAMREFLARVGVSSTSCNHSSLWRADLHTTVRFERSIEMNLDREPPVTNVRVVGKLVMYDMWGSPADAYQLVGGYIHINSALAAYWVPDEVKAITKGWWTTPTLYSPQSAHILRARKPEVRLARLMAAVLTGEAEIHEWEQP